MDAFAPNRISVIMPCHNAALYVVEAVNSVLTQSHPDVELIVVDDGSTDGSETRLTELAAANPGRMVLVHQTNNGPYAARNVGLAHARGNFVAFLDADDIWHVDALAHLYAALLETDADVAYCGWQNIGELAVDTQPYIPPHYAEVDAARAFLKSCPWPVNGVLLKRHLVDSLRGFSERRPTAMDYDLWLRLLPLQPTVVRVPEVLAYYRRYPRGHSHIPRWRQVFDAIAVREDFARHYPEQVSHLPRTERDHLLYGSLLPEAYRCHWRRDTESSRRLFRLASRRSRWQARDAKYILASFLPARAFNALISFVDTRRSARNTP